MTAATLYASLLIAASVALAAAHDCDCSNERIEGEATELFEFLKRVPSEDQVLMPVIAGELSPLLPCENCLEKNRRKRKIEERANKQRAREERSPAFFRVWRHADESRNKCPLGYRRVSFMCVVYNH